MDDLDAIHATVARFTQLRIQARLDETLHIPPLPDAARRIVVLKQNPNHDLMDLVTIIETDPPLAARVMGWAASAYYAASPPPRNLADAVMRVLGFEVVYSVALSMALGDSLRLPKREVDGAKPYWLNSIYHAVTMEALARRMPNPIDPGLCYLTGLLLRFGTLVVGHVFPPQYESICAAQEQQPHLPACQIDEQVLGIKREVLAAELLRQWELPQAVVTTIRNQNEPGYDEDHLNMVQLARLAHTLIDDGLPDVELAEQLDLAMDELEEVWSGVLDAKESMQELARTLSV